MSHYRRPGSGGNKVFLGLIIIVVGVLILLKQLGMIPYLNLHRTWPFVLIVIGVAIGMRNRFTTLAPYILIAIGFSHLIPAFSFTLAGREIDSEEIVIPLLLVGAGLFIMFRPHRRQH